MFLNTTFTFDTWGWQLEAGSVATAFQTATGTIQGELAACYRYFYKSSGGQMAIAENSTNVYTCFPVTMRTAPSVAVTAAMNLDRYGVGAYTQSGAGSVLTGSNYGSVNSTTVLLNNFTGLTTSIPYAVTNAGGSILLSAEL